MQYNGECLLQFPAPVLTCCALPCHAMRRLTHPNIGMGNRFSSIAQYHQLITGHGILAAIVFLFVIPFAVMIARFSRRRDDRAVKHHAYLQVLAVGLTTVVFILGFFAVGPERSLTNPHHGIGVAIYTLILLQALGGRFIRKIRKTSLRIMIHQWFGRTIALLGIAQVPLGLTLYGSPKYTFILFAVWMAFLLLVYFLLSWRHEKTNPKIYAHGGRSVPAGTEYSVSERREERDGRGWLGPLAAGAGIAALWQGRKNRKEKEQSHSRSRSRSHVRSRSRPAEVISSRHGSPSYVEKTEYSEHAEPPKSGGFMNKLLGAAALFGAGAFAKKQLDKRETRRYRDEEYSAVATETPSKSDQRTRPKRPAHSQLTESEFSDSVTEFGRDGRHGGPTAAAAALSAAEARPHRPMTPRPSHHRGPTESRLDSVFSSDYSSYVSPSRRAREEREKGKGGAGKGILAGLGLGWLAAKLQGRKDRRAAEEEERVRYEDERRDGQHGSRLTGDGYGSPRRASRRRPSRPAGTVTTYMTGDSDLSSVEPRPTGVSSAGPPMPPLGPAGHGPVQIRPVAGESITQHGAVVEPVDMPSIPNDPHGILHRSQSGSEEYMSAGGHPHRRHSSRRRRESVAASAAAPASALAAEQEFDSRRTARSHSRAPSQPVSVKVKYHDDRDRNITLRRLTEEEAAREQRRRRRSQSASSLSGSDIGGNGRQRRYRRDSSARRPGDELASEQLSPPAPAFAGGRRPAKDSAYYSGPPPGPSTAPMTPMHGNPTVSSIGSPGSHGEWSALSPSPSGPTGTDGGISAAERRRRRRLERRDQRPPASTVEFS
ncbi:hypothetical protein BKA67DRAFT_550988 [Truncatella angustata]|uniref:Cytochrome b561 domain-containing protein n=1 Tax=Truncatella angustata TaxID=152316 RepID=A0A9P8V0I2_9PEZI|nr:uncharacterized protein BKA67DRAFT_550988 [Truncatella angustata]KAH6661371.1 hypothetical protein BKA67DRAFT_550988 [Truncatella angustata]